MRRMRLCGVAVILALAGCGQASPTVTPGAAAVPTGPVQARSDIVSAEAILVPLRQADLSFRTPGVVAQVAVAEGQAVTDGQELARLDTREPELSVQRAQAGLQAAQAALAKTQAGALAEERAAAEATLQIAEAGAKAATSAAQVAQGNLASAQAGLERAKADAQTAASAVQIRVGDLASARAGLEGAQASQDRLVNGPTSLDLQIAQKQVEAAQNELWGLQAQRDALGASTYSKAQYEAAQGQAAAAESRVQIAQLQLEQLKAGPRAEELALARSQVGQAQAAVQTAQAAYAQAQAQARSAATVQQQAEAGVQVAQAQAAQAQAEIETADARAAQARAQRDLVVRDARAEDVAAAEAQVAQAQAALGEAQLTLDWATLRAPFDGVVGATLVDEGELATAQSPAVRVGDLTQLLVETSDLNEVDIRRVRAGALAHVTVDALPGLAFEATVLRIAPLAADYRGDKVYKVTLELANPTPELRWGMSAFVEIEAK